MKKIIVTVMALSAIISGNCQAENPLLTKYNTPFDTPPFGKIELKHYKPAFEKAVADTRSGIEAITSNKKAPTFENTIVAMENNGRLLGDVAGIFYNLNECQTSDEMQQIAEDIQPMMTELSNDISLNPALFARVKSVYDSRSKLKLTPEQKMLLSDTYKSFARNGAELNDADKAKYREISSELSALSLKFGQNVLAATNAFSINIPEQDKAKIDELPNFVKESMAETAKAKGETGWTVTLQAPSYIPFMTYSSERDLKKTLWTKYGSRGFEQGSNDNSEIVKRIAELRLQKANLLGYKTYADYALEERMAESSKNVNDFLTELLDATMSYAQKDFEAIKQYAIAQGDYENFEFMPWDWGYYDEKYKTEKYSLNEELIKPYLKLENVKNAVFMLAEKLYGLKFKSNKDIARYNPEVEVYEVYDSKDKFMSILYMDFFPRESKRGGAWMTSFRDMYVDENGKEVRPLVSLCCNFTKPTETTPSLLTFDELTTFLHEFGHALHGMLAEGTYASTTGTNVFRDFVELPSQIMENWATEKEFLNMWAVHYKTGEKMPAELIDKIIAAKNYLAAYSNVRQLAYAMNDMAWHSITAPVTKSTDEFEREAIAKAQLFPFVDGTCVSTAFSHIFSGGYSAGYYSYKWAEVLEADAFSMFKEKGVMNSEVAAKFRENILSKGRSEHPMDLYVRFRGRKPSNNALIEKMGIEVVNK